jgi:signal transduction histidine kinase
VLEICDEGVGFDVANVKENARGLGLLLMEYYASQANLSLTVTSTPGKGTLVRAAHLAAQKKEDEKEQSAKP